METLRWLSLILATAGFVAAMVMARSQRRYLARRLREVRAQLAAGWELRPAPGGLFLDAIPDVVPPDPPVDPDELAKSIAALRAANLTGEERAHMLLVASVAADAAIRAHRAVEVYAAPTASKVAA
jgi:hypothetical protein